MQCFSCRAWSQQTNAPILGGELYPGAPFSAFLEFTHVYEKTDGYTIIIMYDSVIRSDIIGQ